MVVSTNNTDHAQDKFSLPYTSVSKYVISILNLNLQHYAIYAYFTTFKSIFDI